MIGKHCQTYAFLDGFGKSFGRVWDEFWEVKILRNRGRNAPRRTENDHARAKAQQDVQTTSKKRPKAKNTFNLAPNTKKKPLLLKPHGSQKAYIYQGIPNIKKKHFFQNPAGAKKLIFAKEFPTLKKITSSKTPREPKS